MTLGIISVPSAYTIRRQANGLAILQGRNNHYKISKGKRCVKLSMLVSINCMTYNHENYIADAIEGFLMQKTDFNFEILIGEDCSTDSTRSIIQEYMNKYPGKIRLITSEKNVGAKKNSQRLVDNSMGKYIAECEGDDYWIDPLKLQKQVDYMEKNPECTLIFHAAEVRQGHRKQTRKRVEPYKGDRISPIEDIITGGGAFCATASLLYPKKLMENPPDFYFKAHVGDYPLQMYLASQGYAYYLDELMSVYRKGVEGSWTSQLNSGGNIRGRLIEVCESDIKLLMEFNEYTNLMYFNTIENVILKMEFNSTILKRNNKKKVNPKYKEYINGMGIHEKAIYMIKRYFPDLYILITQVRASL